MGLNKKCEDFSGRYTCAHFGGERCSFGDRIWCHIYEETGKQPVEDDVPLQVGMVLEAFPGSKVVAVNQLHKETVNKVIDNARLAARRETLEKLKEILGGY